MAVYQGVPYRGLAVLALLQLYRSPRGSAVPWARGSTRNPKWMNESAICKRGVSMSAYRRNSWKIQGEFSVWCLVTEVLHDCL